MIPIVDNQRLSYQAQRMPYRHAPYSTPHPVQTEAIQHGAPQRVSETTRPTTQTAEAFLGRGGVDEVVLGAEISRRLEALHEERAEHGLKAGVWATFKFLLASALTSNVRRGFSLQASQSTLHIAVRLLCVELCLSPTTVYRHLALLRAAGLVDYRAFKVEAPADWQQPGHPEGDRGGSVLNTGTLIAVRLRAGFTAPVRLRREDFSETPRDMMGDLESGNTVTAYVAGLSIKEKAARTARKWRWKKSGRIDIPQGWSVDVEVLVDFSLPPEAPGKAPLPISVQFSREAQKAAPEREFDIMDMFGLPGLNGAEAREWIDGIARSIRGLLGDSKGDTVWHHVLWRLYRHARFGGVDRFQRFFEEVNRSRAEMRDQELQNPAASLINRLRQRDHGFWSWLQDAPAHPA